MYWLSSKRSVSVDVVLATAHIGGGLDFVRKVGIFLSFILTLFLLSQRQIWEKFLRTIELLCPRPGSPGPKRLP